jgi:hypothetical protein
MEGCCAVRDNTCYTHIVDHRVLLCCKGGRRERFALHLVHGISFSVSFQATKPITVSNLDLLEGRTDMVTAGKRVRKAKRSKFRSWIDIYPEVKT